MKAIISLFFILSAFMANAQSKCCTFQSPSAFITSIAMQDNIGDTLVVDEKKYRFIKIGDKVYRIVTTITIQESLPQMNFRLGSGSATLPMNTPFMPATTISGQLLTTQTN